MRRCWLIGLLGVLTLLLSACFRDAGEDQGEITTIDIQDVMGSPAAPIGTPSPTLQQVATLTATPEIAPTNTFPVGGPPINNNNSSNNRTATPSNPAGIPTRTPTRLIPSFTPSGSTFGDLGVTPTSAIPTLAAPDALAPTPTDIGLVPENDCIHLVAANESLIAIATQYEVTVDDFVAANPELAANPNALQINQQLQVPNCGTPEPSEGVVVEGTAEPDAPPATTAAPAGTQTHTVQDGENLFRISVQYNTTVDAIIAANPELGGGTLIYPGQVLIIPTGQ